MSKDPPVHIAPDFAEHYPDASARATECAMNLVFTSDLLVKHVARLLQPFDLSPASGLALSLLADCETPLSPHEIADELIISRASATSLIDSLERRGFARRIPHQSDRRMLLVEITAKGRQVADEFRPVVHAHQKAWLEPLSDADQQQLIALLHRVQASLIQADDED